MRRSSNIVAYHRGGDAKRTSEYHLWGVRSMLYFYGRTLPKYYWLVLLRENTITIGPRQAMSYDLQRLHLEPRTSPSPTALTNLVAPSLRPYLPGSVLLGWHLCNPSCLSSSHKLLYPLLRACARARGSCWRHLEQFKCPCGQRCTDWSEWLELPDSLSYGPW